MDIILSQDKQPTVEKINDFIKTLSINEQEAILNFMQGVQFIKKISNDRHLQDTA